MRLVRSITSEQAMTFSILRCCIPVSSSSKITYSISFSWQYSLISSSLPGPMYVALSGLSRRWVNILSGMAPAVVARNANSSRYSCTLRSPPFSRMTPTKTALLVLNSLIECKDKKKGLFLWSHCSLFENDLLKIVT